MGAVEDERMGLAKEKHGLMACQGNNHLPIFIELNVTMDCVCSSSFGFLAARRDPVPKPIWEKVATHQIKSFES
jgi:hypothetical protein